MTHLKDYIEAIEYKVTGGSEYTWHCFGDNARYLDCSDSETSDGTYSVTAVFNNETQQVYCIEAWDYVNDREYRWIDPEYQKAFKKECKKNNVDPNESTERNFIDLEISEDILEKINAIVNNRPYDSRVKVPVDFSDEELLQYMKLAHEMDITFNELIERALREAIDEQKRDPKGFKQRAEKFINENSNSE